MNPKGSTLRHNLEQAQEKAANDSKIQVFQSNEAFAFRLYTEKNDGLLALVRRYFSGATIYKTLGFYESTEEASVVVEVIVPVEQFSGTASAFRALAFAIKREFDQKEVLFSWTPTNYMSIR